jgi:hypothetical protein
VGYETVSLTVNTRMLLLYYLMLLLIAVHFLLHVTIFVLKIKRAHLKYKYPIPSSKLYMTRYYIKDDQKNDQKTDLYPILPLSEFESNFDTQKMTKIDRFFCKKPGKSENIPLFCQKTPQKHQILL